MAPFVFTFSSLKKLVWQLIGTFWHFCLKIVYHFLSHFKLFQAIGSHFEQFKDINLVQFVAIWRNTGQHFLLFNFFVHFFWHFQPFLGNFLAPFWHLLASFWNGLTLLEPFGATPSHLELFEAIWSHL